MKLNTAKPVKVYRKLAGKGYRKGLVLYSIKQGNRVLAVRERVILAYVRFKVSEPGRQRVIQSKRKNVHAFAIGYLRNVEFTPENITPGCRGIDETGKDLPVRIKYNPYKYGNFYTTSAGGNDLKIHGADCVLFNERGVTAAYTF